MGIRPQISRRVEHDLDYLIIGQRSKDVGPQGSPKRIVRAAVKLLA
ncbi:hypothetical protein [Rhodoferax sp.]|nr:hypothetical protein [Rhodoferax sp.]MDD3936904.1 hypothetical protein [Rhodoferax sp.]